MNEHVTLIIGTNPLTIAVYTRVSTDQQSIASQEQAINDWLERQKYDSRSIERYTDEGYSGATTKRPAFEQLVKQIRSQKIRRVLVFESSRLSRDFFAYLDFLNVCHENACVVEVIGKGEIAFGASQDMLIASIHAFLNSAERERISERVKAGMAAAKKRGVKVGARRGERRALGHRKKHPRKMIQEIRFLAQKGLSTRAIAQTLGQKYTERPLTHTKVARLLKKNENDLPSVEKD